MLFLVKLRGARHSTLKDPNPSDHCLPKWILGGRVKNVSYSKMTPLQNASMTLYDWILRGLHFGCDTTPLLPCYSYVRLMSSQATDCRCDVQEREIAWAYFQNSDPLYLCRCFSTFLLGVFGGAKSMDIQCELDPIFCANTTQFKSHVQSLTFSFQGRDSGDCGRREMWVQGHGKQHQIRLQGNLLTFFRHIAWGQTNVPHPNVQRFHKFQKCN